MKIGSIEIRKTPQVNPKSADELWVCANGTEIRVGDMSESHVRHSLALILRHARAGATWRMNTTNGKMQYRYPQILGGDPDWERAYWEEETRYGTSKP